MAKDNTLYYPLAAATATKNGHRNAVAVTVMYYKSHKAMMLNLVLVGVTSGGGFDGVAFAPFSDPTLNEVLWAMSRDNAKLTHKAFVQIELEIGRREGTGWDVLSKFAKRHGLELADNMAVMPKIESALV